MRDSVMSSVLLACLELFEEKQVNVRPCYVYAVAAFAAITVLPTFAAIAAHAAVSAMALSAVSDIPRYLNPVPHLRLALSEQANSQALLQKEAVVVEPPKLALPE